MIIYKICNNDNRLLNFTIQLPNWGFGTSERMSKDKPKYDFYENAMFLDDAPQADLSRKPRCAAPKIGTEPRVSIKFYLSNLL